MPRGNLLQIRITRGESTRHSPTFIGAQLVKLTVNTAIILVIKNSIHKRRIRFVVFSDFQNFLSDGMFMVFQEVLGETRSVRFGGTFVS